MVLAFAGDSTITSDFDTLPPPKSGTSSINLTDLVFYLWNLVQELVWLQEG
jgi:hypothetical protein